MICVHGKKRITPRLIEHKVWEGVLNLIDLFIFYFLNYKEFGIKGPSFEPKIGLKHRSNDWICLVKAKSIKNADNTIQYFKYYSIFQKQVSTGFLPS